MKLRQAKKIVCKGASNYKKSTFRIAVNRLARSIVGPHARQWLRRMVVMRESVAKSNLELMA